MVWTSHKHNKLAQAAHSLRNSVSRRIWVYSLAQMMCSQLEGVMQICAGVELGCFALLSVKAQLVHDA
jgi:hypothetical protein